MYKYEIINYFDVWGNKKDGYEVNNLCSEGFIELSENYTMKKAIKKLKEIGFVNKYVRENQFDIYNDHEMIEFYSKKTRSPLFRLELKQMEVSQ